MLETKCLIKEGYSIQQHAPLQATIAEQRSTLTSQRPDQSWGRGSSARDVRHGIHLLNELWKYHYNNLD